MEFRRVLFRSKAAALAGGALGQHVLQLARGEALQLDLAGRGRADDADLGGGQGVDGGNLHVSADAMELEDDFAGLWHGSSIAHYGKQTLNRPLWRIDDGWMTVLGAHGSQRFCQGAICTISSEERRVGTECVSTGSSRWSPGH